MTSVFLILNYFNCRAYRCKLTLIISKDSELLPHNRYNTVEPEAYLANTAVLLLYKKRDYATASRTNGPTLLRRSNRLNMLQLHHAPTRPHLMNFKSLAFGSAMKLLDELLEIEVKADRYDPHIGFHE